MKKTVSIDLARLLVGYDPISGVLTRNVTRGNSAAGSQLGSLTNHGYLAVMVDGRWDLVHRWAWYLMTESWPCFPIDHVNCIRTDNRWSNLRAATATLNARNMHKARPNNVTGLIGVQAKANGRFYSKITVDRRIVSLGTFSTPEAAQAAYIAAKRRLHPGCIR